MASSSERLLLDPAIAEITYQVVAFSRHSVAFNRLTWQSHEVFAFVTIHCRNIPKKVNVNCLHFSEA